MAAGIRAKAALSSSGRDCFVFGVVSLWVEICVYIIGEFSSLGTGLQQKSCDESGTEYDVFVMHAFRGDVVYVFARDMYYTVLCAKQ